MVISRKNIYNSEFQFDYEKTVCEHFNGFGKGKEVVFPLKDKENNTDMVKLIIIFSEEVHNGHIS